MTEAIFLTLLHQDPRYFRRGTGSGWSRFGYTVRRILWTHNDSARWQFNFSEIADNYGGSRPAACGRSTKTPLTHVGGSVDSARYRAARQQHTRRRPGSHAREDIYSKNTGRVAR